MNSPRPPESLAWLWPQRIPLGKITLLDGAPGCGTSLFTITLAACVNSGSPWPDGIPCTQGGVLLITPHDNFNDTIKPRLLATGTNHRSCLNAQQRARLLPRRSI